MLEAPHLKYQGTERQTCPRFSFHHLWHNATQPTHFIGAGSIRNQIFLICIFTHPEPRASRIKTALW